MRLKSLRFFGVPIALTLLATGPVARGEAPGTAPAAPAGQGASGGPGRGVQVMSDGVFNIDQPPPPPSNAVSAGGRAFGEVGDYRSEKWKAKCASYKGVDMVAYRKCYFGEKAVDDESVRRNLDRRGNSGTAFRSISPASPLDAAPAARVPSGSNGVDIESLVGKDPDKENIE